MATNITVTAEINATPDRVWELWTSPQHVTKWNNASDDWHTPHAENDLRKGGRFTTRMEAKDGSMGFDFGGTYDEVIPNEVIAYTMDDGRKVRIVFTVRETGTYIEEIFEAEGQHPEEMQREGWQAILDNFKNYAENN